MDVIGRLIYDLVVASSSNRRCYVNNDSIYGVWFRDIDMKNNLKYYLYKCSFAIHSMAYFGDDVASDFLSTLPKTITMALRCISIN